MVTRRAVLRGTAAGSIAAIASAHGVAPAGAEAGFAAGYENLEGGALGAFQKAPNGYSVFFKFFKTAAEVFYKENLGAVDIFFKFFDKDWKGFLKLESLDIGSLQGAEAGFYKLQPDSAGFFLKVPGADSHYLNVSSDGQYGFDGPRCETND